METDIRSVAAMENDSVGEGWRDLKPEDYSVLLPRLQSGDGVWERDFFISVELYCLAELARDSCIAAQGGA